MMQDGSTLTLKALAHKLALYAGEAAFAARAPVSVRDSLRLIGSTAAFHYRNWRRLPPDPAARQSLSLAIAGCTQLLTLRPRDGDLAILYEVFVRRSYEIPSCLLPPMNVRTIVDAGANIGLSSLYFAARYPKATIIAVEPNPDNFALLEGNTRTEPRIRPVRACLTPQPEEEVFIATSGRGSHFQMNTTGNGAPVRGISLDALSAEHGLDRIDLFKIDIEGAEEAIFADAAFLPRVGVVAAELHGAYDLARFNADIAAWGFSAWANEIANDPMLVIAARKS